MEENSNGDAFWITSIRSEDTVSGDLHIEVAVRDKSIEDQELEIVVDGDRCGCGFFGTDYKDRPEWRMVFTLPTQEFSNGAHEIMVRDSLTRSRSPQIRSETLKVSFRNAIHNLQYDGVFSPTSSTLSKTCRVQASLHPAQPWQVLFQNLNPAISSEGGTRTFHGSGDKVDAEWNGSDDERGRSESANYLVTVTALLSQETAEFLVNQFRDRG